MPRENRKRGKKTKAKTQDVEYCDPIDDVHLKLELQTFDHGQDGSKDSPFGTLDPDVKAYFQTVNDQLRDWQEEKPDIETDLNPNEERRIFFTAALSEMHGKELQLATDPDCSQVLERMLYSMDDFIRRVFTDSLAGSWVKLVTNRFSSHVCQTLFTVAADTVARETRGIIPSTPSTEDGRGELLTMTRLILDACEDFIPELPHLIQNTFASHVLRTLLVLLAPSQFRLHNYAPSLRSKKSASWKARRGPMKAAIIDRTQPDGINTTANLDLPTPNSFSKMAEMFVDKVRDALSGNEIRALAVDKVASPMLQMLLEMEASVGKSDSPGSIMDRLLAGLITESRTTSIPSTSPYVSTLILDTTASHISESLFSHCPSNIFERLWDYYVRGDLPKLAMHPIANFVVARGVERLETAALRETAMELNPLWIKSLRASRMGVMIAMVNRAGQIGVHEAELIDAVCSLVEVNTDDERKVLVPCLLRLKTRSEYQAVFASGTNGEKRNDEANPQTFVTSEQECPLFEPKTQGSILIQSLLRLHEPHNHVILESLLSLVPTELLALAQNATSSRIFDAAFESLTVPLRFRKRLVTAFMGYFHLLVDDRIGSRVADRCWEAADPYLKEKIARSLIPHEHFLAGSHFGRFFTRKLGLPLLQRKPDQWKVLQTKSRGSANEISITQVIPAITEPGVGSALSTPDIQHTITRKRKITGNGDEIDALFRGIGAKKRVKGVTEGDAKFGEVAIDEGDSMLKAVLGAIKTAPGDVRSMRKKKNK